MPNNNPTGINQFTKGGGRGASKGKTGKTGKTSSSADAKRRELSRLSESAKRSGTAANKLAISKKMLAIRKSLLKK